MWPQWVPLSSVRPFADWRVWGTIQIIRFLPADFLRYFSNLLSSGFSPPSSPLTRWRGCLGWPSLSSRRTSPTSSRRRWPTCCSGAWRRRAGWRCWASAWRASTAPRASRLSLSALPSPGGFLFLFYDCFYQSVSPEHPRVKHLNLI